MSGDEPHRAVESHQIDAAFRAVLENSELAAVRPPHRPSERYAIGARPADTLTGDVIDQHRIVCGESGAARRIELVGDPRPVWGEALHVDTVGRQIDRREGAASIHPSELVGRALPGNVRQRAVCRNRQLRIIAGRELSFAPDPFLERDDGSRDLQRLFVDRRHEHAIVALEEEMPARHVAGQPRVLDEDDALT